MARIVILGAGISGHTAALLEAIPPNAWFQTFVPEQSKCD